MGYWFRVLTLKTQGSTWVGICVILWCQHSFNYKGRMNIALVICQDKVVKLMANIDIGHWASHTQIGFWVDTPFNGGKLWILWTHPIEIYRSQKIDSLSTPETHHPGSPVDYEWHLFQWFNSTSKTCMCLARGIYFTRVNFFHIGVSKRSHAWS